MSLGTISAVTEPHHYREQNLQRGMNNARTASKTFRLWTQHYPAVSEQVAVTGGRAIDGTLGRDQKSMRTIAGQSRTLKTSRYISTKPYKYTCVCQAVYSIYMCACRYIQIYRLIVLWGQITKVWKLFKTKLNSVAWVHDRTIPTDRPPLVGEVSADFMCIEGDH
jgi:hypothetical protein